MRIERITKADQKKLDLALEEVLSPKDSIENGMVPVPPDHQHDRETLPNPGGKWRWDNDEGWVAPGYEFVKADLLFYDKMGAFITTHRKNHPDQPFLAVLSTQIAQ